MAIYEMPCEMKTIRFAQQRKFLLNKQLKTPILSVAFCIPFYFQRTKFIVYGAY